MDAQLNDGSARLIAASIDRDTLEVRAVCTGADHHGDCPRVVDGEVVPCAGSYLAAAAPEVGWYLQLDVGDFATACPLRGFVTPT